MAKPIPLIGLKHFVSHEAQVTTENPAHQIHKASGERHCNRPWSSVKRDAVFAALPDQRLGPMPMMRDLGVRLGDARDMLNEACDAEFGWTDRRRSDPTRTAA